MIHANPLSDVFTSVSGARDYTINKPPGFLFVATDAGSRITRAGVLRI
jgi:hypothetical protein